MLKPALSGSAGHPIPGATVTITQEGKKTVTTTDEDGRYEVTGLNPGGYTIDVSMFGFRTSQRKFESNTGPTAIEWSLDLQQRMAAGPGFRRGVPGGAGGQQTQAAATEIETALTQAPALSISSGGGGDTGNEAFLLNGSLSRGLQSGQADSLAQQGPEIQGRPGGPNGPGGPGGFGDGQAGAPGAGGPGAGGGGGRGGVRRWRRVVSGAVAEVSVEVAEAVVGRAEVAVLEVLVEGKRDATRMVPASLEPSSGIAVTADAKAFMAAPISACEIRHWTQSLSRSPAKTRSKRLTRKPASDSLSVDRCTSRKY